MARIVEYQHLNKIFVLATQWVLDRLANGPMLVSDYNVSLSAHPPQNRQNILNVLYNADLITIENQIMRLTEKGADYQRWPARQDWVQAQYAVATAPAATPTANYLVGRNILADLPPDGSVTPVKS